MIPKLPLLLLLLGMGNLVQGFLAPQQRSSSSSSSTSARAAVTVEKTDAEWREVLTPEQFRVLREDGTEAPNSSALDLVKDPGTFSCAGCGAPLFTTAAKFDSGTGWPSFYGPLDNGAVATSTDFKMILPREECTCAQCGGHLGHVFGDGPDPTGQRYCMNGVAMRFVTDAHDPDLAAAVQTRQASDPYTLGLMQVLPSVMINGILGGLFFNAFVTRLETTGLSSPFDVFPLVPAVYFGVLAVKTCGRLNK